MARKKSTRSSNKKRTKRRRANAQRSGLFWGFGILAAIVGVLFFAFSGGRSGSTTNQSEAEVVDLPVGPQIGSLAPDFSLNTARGSKAGLSDFRGKPIAIMFFHSW